MNSRMMTAVEISYTELYSLLTEAYRSSQSCCFHLFTQNSSGRILFEAGEIKFITFDAKRGNEAIEIIKNLQNIKYRLARFLPMPADKNLLDTASILEMLAPNGSTAPQINRAEPNNKNSLGFLPQANREIVREILTDMMGPMADIFMADHVDNAGSIQEIIRNLSTDLSSEDIKYFTTEVNRHINLNKP